MADSYVYVIATVRGGRAVAPIKVGMSDDPKKRRRQLQTGYPYPLMLVHAFATPDRKTAVSLESGFRRMKEDRHLLGDWFDIAPAVALQVLCLAFEIILRVNEVDEDDAEQLRVSLGFREGHRKSIESGLPWSIDDTPKRDDTP